MVAPSSPHLSALVFSAVPRNRVPCTLSPTVLSVVQWPPAVLLLLPALEPPAAPPAMLLLQLLLVLAPPAKPSDTNTPLTPPRPLGAPLSPARRSVSLAGPCAQALLPDIDREGTSQGMQGSWGGLRDVRAKSGTGPRRGQPVDEGPVRMHACMQMYVCACMHRPSARSAGGRKPHAQGKKPAPRGSSSEVQPDLRE